MAHPQFEAVNLISDPIHGYIELTKRLTREQSDRAGLPPELVAEEDLLDSPWLQRLRRISQLQSARWVFPTAEHSRFTHGLGVMHEAGLWARALYPTLRETLLADTLAEGEASEDPIPTEALVVETLRVAGLVHDVGHGPFAHFFDDHVLARFPAPPHPSRDPAKRLSHEDLGQAIIERELAPIVAGLRRAPALEAERAAFGEGEAIEPRWIGFLISKPPLADATMPLWVRRLQPLFSGIFTVDNLDYVRRDAYMTGVSTGPIDADRLRRYAFMTQHGLTIYEPGLGALEQFLAARLYMYNTVYFHRAVRAIDLDLQEVFAPSVAALYGLGNPIDDLASYVALDEYALLHAASLWAAGEALADDPEPGSGQVTPAVGALWRHIVLRRPTWRAIAEVRRDSRSGGSRAEIEAALVAGSGGAEGMELRLDLAETDARPQNPLHKRASLIVARRDGTLDPSALRDLLERLPAVVVVGRAYVRSPAAADLTFRPKVARSARAFVVRHTRLRPVPGLEAVRLHLADDVLPLWHAVQLETGDPDAALPYWAFAWAGGLALCHYLGEHPDAVVGRKVVDLASGSGLCAIAAARAGATAVTGADIDAFAATAIELNARANGQRVTVVRRDLLDEPPPPVDVILAGDCWYDAGLARRVLPWLQAARRRGIDVLVGDPGRRYLPADDLIELACYDVRTTTELEDLERKQGRVYALPIIT